MDFISLGEWERRAQTSAATPKSQSRSSSQQSDMTLRPLLSKSPERSSSLDRSAVASSSSNTWPSTARHQRSTSRSRNQFNLRPAFQNKPSTWRTLTSESTHKTPADLRRQGMQLSADGKRRIYIPKYASQGHSLSTTGQSVPQHWGPSALLSGSHVRMRLQRAEAQPIGRGSFQQWLDTPAIAGPSTRRNAGTNDRRSFHSPSTATLAHNFGVQPNARRPNPKLSRTRAGLSNLYTCGPVSPGNQLLRSRVAQVRRNYNPPPQMGSRIPSKPRALVKASSSGPVSARTARSRSRSRSRPRSRSRSRRGSEDMPRRVSPVLLNTIQEGQRSISPRQCLSSQVVRVEEAQPARGKRGMNVVERKKKRGIFERLANFVVGKGWKTEEERGLNGNRVATDAGKNDRTKGFWKGSGKKLRKRALG